MQKAEILRSHAESIAESGDQAQQIISEDGTMGKLRGLENQKVTPADVQVGIRRVTVRVRRHVSLVNTEIVINIGSYS